MLMKMKKVLSALCAAAILISALTTGLYRSLSRAIYAEEGIIISSGTVSEPEDLWEETDFLPIPQNLRFEDGFIKWDKVKEAYGYIIRIHTGDEEREYREITKYVDYYDPDDEAQLEFDRLCYEQSLDFGSYDVDICSFDEGENRTEWSETITAEYAPTLDAPANVRLSEEEEETLLWDEVEGAYRYNIKIFNDDENRTLYFTTYKRYPNFYFYGYLDKSGNYWISLQTMDRDYNVSEWTEPVLVSHTHNEVTLPDTPQNIRFDETGENILWDEVAGAEHYRIQFDIYIDVNGDLKYVTSETDFPTEPCCINWKRFAVPFSNTKYRINVWAYFNGEFGSNGESIEVSFDANIDESIEVPELRLEDNNLLWDNVECAERYFLNFTVNGQDIINNYINVFDAYSDGNGVWIGDYPAGDYEATLYVMDKNHNYNKKTYNFTFGKEPDESVWVPKLYYKSDSLLWDWDRIRHDNTDSFWVRITDKASGKVVKLGHIWSENFYGFLNDLPNGYYDVEVCVYEYDGKFGPWAKLTNLENHDGSYFDDNNEIKGEIITPPEAEEIPEEERVTEIYVNPAFNMKHKDGDDVELDLSKIEIKAKEIYDEEGLKRVEEALGHKIKKNQKYNLLDLTLLYKGEDFSNGYEGLVKVIIPIPSGHRDKTFTVYRLTEIDGQTVKEVIPGEQTEDSYIIYLEHFSEYVLFGEGEDEHTHIFPEEWTSDETNHWKECECGEKSEESAHTYGDWTITKEATEAEEGSKERACEVCGYKETETIPTLSHTHIFKNNWSTDETNHWKECECGEKSEESAHTYGDWTITKEATEAEEGSKERACEVCGYKETESLPKLSPVTPSETEKPDDKNQNTGVAASVSSVSALLISGGLIILLSGKRKVK